ncbi:MAG: integrase arm-type DNA-binding domain-containing protein [Vicinamibacteria bacterium]|nr:integrase arm-type DNA-binding domain-containing protein [Vicinamibacteria bacterium]
MRTTWKKLRPAEVQALIDRLEPGNHQDPDRRGLWVRVRPSGARSWVLRYGHAGHRLTLGRADGLPGSLNVTEARREAKKQKAEIDAAQSGAKYRAKVERERIEAEEKRKAEEKAKRETEAAETLETLARSIIAGADIRPSTRRGWDSILKASIIPTLGAMKAQDIRKEDVRRALSTIKARSTWAADSAHKLLTLVFRLAVERDILPSSPMTGVRRADFRVKDGGRRRVVLTPDQLRALWTAADSQGLYGAGVRLGMLTLARRGEIFEAKTAEFDLTGKVWRIPGERRKNGEPLTVPLAQDAVTLLKGLIEQSEAIGSLYLFPGLRGALKPTSKAWDALLIAAGIAEPKKGKKASAATEGKAKERRKWTAHPARFHDLRRAGRSILETELEVSASVAEAVLGHLAPSLNRVYSPEGTGVRERARALDAWAKHLAAIVSAESPKPGKVLTGRFGA